MATIKNLDFNKDGNLWICSFSSDGDSIIQILRETNDVLKVTAAIPTFETVTLYERGASFSEGADNIIFSLELPVGLDVVIKSHSKVKAAKIMVLE